MALRIRILPALMVLLLALSGCGRTGVDTLTVCGDCGCHGIAQDTNANADGETLPDEDAADYDIVVVVVFFIVIIIIVGLLSQSGEG